MKKMSRYVIACLAASIAAAQAGVIAINFQGTQNKAGSEYGTDVTATAFGVAAGDWVSGQLTARGAADSVAAANLPTGVAASWTMKNDYALALTPAGYAPGEEQVAFGFLADGGDAGPGATITLTGLSAWLAAEGATSYKVDLIFASNNDTYGWKETPLLVSDGGASLGTFVAGSDTAVPGGIYAVGTLSGLTSDTLFVDGQDRDRVAIGDAADLRGTIGGVIITPIPEPATLGLVVASLGGLLFVRRRFML
jgi:hypothetical protein